MGSWVLSFIWLWKPFQGRVVQCSWSFLIRASLGQLKVSNTSCYIQLCFKETPFEWLLSSEYLYWALVSVYNGKGIRAPQVDWKKTHVFNLNVRGIAWDGYVCSSWGATFVEKAFKSWPLSQRPRLGRLLVQTFKTSCIQVISDCNLSFETTCVTVQWYAQTHGHLNSLMDLGSETRVATTPGDF